MERIPFETILIGPNALLREGLARILRDASFRVIASAPHVDVVLRTLPQDQSILLIIDVGDDSRVAERQIESFKRLYPAGRVAVLAYQYHLSEMLSAFRAGANAYFVRVMTCDTFLKSLELVMLGETIVPAGILGLVGVHGNGCGNDSSSDSSNEPQLSDRHDRTPAKCNHGSDENDDDSDDQANHNGASAGALAEARIGSTLCLSDRQQAILDCLIKGYSNKAIARKIAITEGTVKVHVKAILRKIRVQNRTQAAIWAINHGRLAISSADAGSSVATTQSMPPLGGIPQMESGGPLARGRGSAP